MAKIAYLECSKCGEHLSGAQPQTICPKDGGSLYVRFDLSALKGKFTPDSLRGREASMWRYREVLPGDRPVSLGEGFTPMLPSRSNPNLWIKDEGLNPTGSFKARGLCAAVTMAREYGLKKLAVPSAGNAASALAAYCAAAGIEARALHLAKRNALRALSELTGIFRRTQSDVVVVRGYSAEDGKILWDFDTVREFQTVNGVKGKGGSIDGPGVVVVNGMVFVNSGYSRFGGMPGNVLLAFAP